MAETIATLGVDITANTQSFDKGLAHVDSSLRGAQNSINSAFSQVGSGIMQGLGISVGMGIADVSTRIVGLGVDAFNMAASFDASMRNIQAVTGQTNDEIGALGQQLNMIGANSIAGPQAVADAYYDIAGSVSNAANRMPILQAALATAEAGAADLGGTVKALTSVMNSYSYEADQATFVSDTLTRTVGMGVGTMDEFAGAFANVSGTAAGVGIRLENLGASMAFITTKGFTASQASTQLNAAITAIIKPSESMKDALSRIGVESGSAALEMWGLEGTLGRLDQAMGGSVDSMAEILGSQEALRASIALNSSEYEGFLGTFEDSIAGATEAARGMQLESFNAQWALLKNKISAVGIAIGTELLPYAIQAVDVLANLATIGAGILGIDLNFDVDATGLTDAITAATEMGPALPPIEMSQSVTVTLAGGDSLWSQWSQEFSDSMSWEEFRSQGEQAAIAQGFPNVSSLPTGFAFQLQIEGGATVTSGATEGATQWAMDLDTLTASMYNNTEEQKKFQGQVDPTSEAIGRLNTSFEEATGLKADFGFPLSGLQAGYDLAIQFGDFMVGVLPDQIDSASEAQDIFGKTSVIATKSAMDGFWALNEKIKGADLSVEGLKTTAANFTIGAGITAFKTFLGAVDSDINAIKDNLPTIGSIHIPIPPGLQSVYDMIMGAIGGLDRLGIGGGNGGNPGTNNWSQAVFDQVAAQTNGSTPVPGAPPPRDSGGPGMAGQPYLIGVGAQPEVFIPDTSGTFIPNFDQYMSSSTGGGGGAQYVTVNATFTDANSFFDTMEAIRGQRFN